MVEGVVPVIRTGGNSRVLKQLEELLSDHDYAILDTNMLVNFYHVNNKQAIFNDPSTPEEVALYVLAKGMDEGDTRYTFDFGEFFENSISFQRAYLRMLLDSQKVLVTHKVKDQMERGIMYYSKTDYDARRHGINPENGLPSEVATFFQEISRILAELVPLFYVRNPEHQYGERIEIGRADFSTANLAIELCRSGDDVVVLSSDSGIARHFARNIGFIENTESSLIQVGRTYSAHRGLVIKSQYPIVE